MTEPMARTTPDARTIRLRFARLGAELNANLGVHPTRALTNQGNRRPPRRAAPPVGVRVDRVVRPRAQSFALDVLVTPTAALSNESLAGFRY